MDASFFDYLQRLEMMAFFSGYPFIYALVIFIFGNKQSKPGIGSRVVSLLPFAYALVGTLFLGIQLKNLYPDYSIENIIVYMDEPYLKIWGILSLLFWIPALGKKPVISLLHSLVFFYFLIRNISLHLLSASVDKYALKNEMKVYTDSLLLNISALAGIAIIYFLIAWLKKNNNSSRVS